MTELSIIIPSYNTEKITLKCLQSIFSNLKQITFEVIVVDNNSQDRTIDLIKKNKFPNLNIISNDKNLGFSKAVNIGIKSSKGNNILILNSDIEIKKGSVEKLVNFVKKKKDVGAVVPKLLYPNGKEQESVLHFPEIKNAISEYWFNKKGSFEKYLPRDKNPVKIDAAVMAAFLITKEGLKKAGMLNEKYFMYFEDIDYCRKLKKEGLDIFYIPTSEVVHHHGASGKNLADKNNQWRRLIPSSKIYHGVLKHYIINAIIYSGQKWQKVLKLFR